MTSKMGEIMKNQCSIVTTFVLFFFFGVAPLFFIAPPTWADSIPDFTIMTEDWKPYNFEENDMVQGISVDMIVLILERIGSKQGREDIKILPWARGYLTVQNEPNTILFSTVRTAEREKMFKWAGPIYEVSQLLFAQKTRKIRIDSPNDLKKYKICTYIDDVSEQLLVKKCGMKLEELDRSPKPFNCISKLQVGRVDLAPFTQEGFESRCKQLGLNADDFEPVYVLSTDLLCYAFHKDTADSLIEKFQKAFSELKVEGKLDEIIRKYKKQPD